MEYIIELENITKIFNESFFANNDISLKFEKGKIHSLLGENGAGKSTLMSILFGITQPTYGVIKIDGVPVNIYSPEKAKKLGIGMVHQSFNLVSEFKVWQNIVLGNEVTNKFNFMLKGKMIEKIEKIMDKYKIYLDLNKKVKDLPIMEQQKLEILKVLYRNARILIFDEPTSVLSVAEIEAFFKVLDNLRQEGKTIIFVSHKLEEIKRVSDVVSVIRNGKKIETFSIKSKTIDEIAQLIVGKKIVLSKNKHESVSKKSILKIKNLTYSKNKIKYVDNINLEVKSGEIVALAGVSGNGQNEILELITGMLKANKGQIFIEDEEITNMKTYKRYLKNISYVPNDRHKYALINDFSVLNNLMLHNLYKKPFVNLGLLNKDVNVYYAQQIIKEYDVKCQDNGYEMANSLSGGNQQRLVIGREMKKDHKLLIISEPTVGLDIGSINYINERILEEKNNNNVGILLLSYDLNEVLSLADRIVVINSGKVAGTLSWKEATRQKIGKLMISSN